VVIRGKKEPKKPMGDAEQQALIAAGKDEGEGGEKLLGTGRAAAAAAGQWHKVMLRFEGAKVTGLVDGVVVVTAEDRLYGRGMAGLMAGVNGKKFSRARFDELVVNRVVGGAVEATGAMAGQVGMYGGR